MPNLPQKKEQDQLNSKSPVFKNSKPKVSRKRLGYPDENKYNQLITGWTAYWNNIFKPKKPLHPNYVKALIASESGFDFKESAKNRLKVGQAQGLVQLTEQTQKILKDREGELRNHYVPLTKKEPTWEEVIYEYKGILLQKHKKSDDIRIKYKMLLKRLNENSKHK